MDQKNIAALEAVLFINGEALTWGALEKILKISKPELAKTVNEYGEVLKKREGGLVLIHDTKSVRLGVRSEYTPFVEGLVKNELQAGLSKAALEVLALVAYLAPVARVEIDTIRGVNSSFTLRNLALRGLVDRRGNPQDARGFVYEPSMNFLTTLGIENISDLPDYEALSTDQRIQTLLGKAVESNPSHSDQDHEEA